MLGELVSLLNEGGYSLVLQKDGERYIPFRNAVWVICIGSVPKIRNSCRELFWQIRLSVKELQP